MFQPQLLTQISILMKTKLHFRKFNVLFISLLIFMSNIVLSQSFRELTKQSEKYFQSQQFDLAVKEAIRALMIKPDFERAQEALTLALPAFLRDYDTKISRLKETNLTFIGDNSVSDWQNIVKEYEFLVQSRDQLLNLPPVINKNDKKIEFSIPDYYSNLLEAKGTLSKMKESAAEQHYLEGLKLMKTGNINDSKQAAKEFKKSLSFVPDYKDATAQYMVARKNGIKRIAIIPFENKSGKTQYGAIGEIITDKIVSDLMNDNSAMEFVEIITRDQLDKVLQEQNLTGSGVITDNSAVQIGKLLGVSEILTGQITQITSSETQPISQTYRDERNWYQNNQTYKIYAKVTTYKKEAKASINGSYKIIDVKTAKLIKTDSFTDSYAFLSEWGTFEGDKNALSTQSFNILSQSEQSTPPDEERVNVVANKLSVSFVKTLILFLK